jgi:hypothetical protein
LPKHSATHVEQVKAEKIGTLKQAAEMEERRRSTFTPRINPNYQLKEKSRTEVTKSHLDAHKRAVQRQAMQQRLDRELGVTHKPTLNDRSRQIAGRSRAELPACTCMFSATAPGNSRLRPPSLM